MSNTMAVMPLTMRARALLRAAAEGRAELSMNCEPDLFIDGLTCCDQPLAHSLVHAGLIRRAHHASTRARTPAALTRKGFEALLSNCPMPQRDAG